MIKTLTRTLATLALALGVQGAAHAAYYVWETVTLKADTGAACGNGTPYRFFINRTLFSSDYALTLEGGGACWDQDACEGVGDYSASNPDGIPGNYMSLPNAAAGGLVTPFSARVDPFEQVQTQDWNLVYLPYCTGDVHSGSAVRLYDDQRPGSPRVQHHKGQANIKAAMDWLRKHEGRPRKLLLTGFSAGGVGATTNYAVARDILQPRGRSSLLADSGPLMNAPRGSTREQSPSLPLHEVIRLAWNLDGAGSLIPTLLAKMPALDVDNLGSLSPVLAQHYPSDRFGYMAFQEDMIFSGFSYLDFHPDVRNEPNPKVQRDKLNALWRQDLAAWLPLLETAPNVDYHLPTYRSFNDAHCLTIVDFSNTGIEEVGIHDVNAFINAVLDRKTAMRHVEQDQVSDYSRPMSPAMTILEIVLDFFG